MKQLTFGLAGEMLSGKSAAAEFSVSHFNAKRITMSVILNRVLDILDLPASRENQSKLVAMLRAQFGEEVLAVALVDSVRRMKDKVLLIDGIRKPEELREFKKLGNFKLIYVKAPLELRYQRQKQRMEKVGESTKSFEEFQQEHHALSEMDIPKLEQYADYVIDNTGSVQDLETHLTKIFMEAK